MMHPTLIRVFDLPVAITWSLTSGAVLLLSIATPSLSAEEAESRLLGHWKFDESTWVGDCVTADILDSSGNGRHGVACVDGDAPVPVPGMLGNAAQFDGVSQYANMGPGFNFTASFSATLWLALDDYLSCGPVGASQHIIGTHHLPTPGGNGRGWGVYWDCDGLAWELTDSTGSAIESYGYIQPFPFPENGSWHHVAIIYDSTIPSATLYWDGVAVYSESGVENVPSHLYDNGEPLTVNGLPYAPSAGAPGRIDDTRVYGRALSPSEVLQIATGVEIAEYPTRFSLAQNIPNPFNPSTTIHYELPVSQTIELAVFDLAGRRVKSLESGFVGAGPHDVRWDGRDEQGRRVASGVYLCRLVASEFSETRRMALLK